MSLTLATEESNIFSQILWFSFMLKYLIFFELPVNALNVWKVSAEQEIRTNTSRSSIPRTESFTYQTLVLLRTIGLVFELICNEVAV